MEALFLWATGKLLALNFTESRITIESMESSGVKRYFLYHKKSDTTVGNLNWTQTKCFCLTLGSERVKDWFIYSESYGDWRPLIDLIFEFVKYSGDKYTYPTPPTTAIKAPKKKEEGVLEEISDERRDSPRFARKLSLILDMDGYLIEGETMDVSLSGLKLSSPLRAESRPKYIMAMVKLEERVINLKLAPVYEGRTGKFQSLICVSCSDLEKWEAQQRKEA